ncbi:MAG: BtaA family protein [Bacteroidota bacterium]
MLKKLSKNLFKFIHKNYLIYNTCWEDPRCDRKLLELDEESEVVMITSAGCNALDYLLESPKKIHCIDLNPKQNSLLELKRALFKNGDFSLLFEFFGTGSHSRAKEIYKSHLQAHLSPEAQTYWQKHIRYFNGKGIKKTFYYCGTSGTIAYFAGKYFKLRKSLFSLLENFFQATSIEYQAQLYQQIERKLWSRSMEWMVNRKFVMYLAGVPDSQIELFSTKYENGTVGFVQERFENVFTRLPVSENYFYHVYFHGEYSENCCPNYLKEGNFSQIREKVDNIQTHTCSVSDFLKNNPGTYSHYILLDHQDWLAFYDKEALEEEWRLILDNSKPGTKILMRSAADTINFFPDFVLEQVEFIPQSELETIHNQDRVGTYGSVYVGVVR